MKAWHRHNNIIRFCRAGDVYFCGVDPVHRAFWAWSCVEAVEMSAHHGPPSVISSCRHHRFYYYYYYCSCCRCRCHTSRVESSTRVKNYTNDPVSYTCITTPCSSTYKLIRWFPFPFSNFLLFFFLSTSIYLGLLW